MTGWVGWPIADGLPTLVVTHQLQVERRTGKVRRPETDVLPLCHATNQRRQVLINTAHNLFKNSLFGPTNKKVGHPWFTQLLKLCVLCECVCVGACVRAGVWKLTPYRDCRTMTNDFTFYLQIGFPAVRLLHLQLPAQWPGTLTDFIQDPNLFCECCSHCRFQPYDCVIISFVELSKNSNSRVGNNT